MDTVTRERRSYIMSRIRSEWTSPERKLYQAMRDLGLDPRTHDRQLPGKPDFVFDGPAFERSDWKPLAVFVEGCFFHACPLHYKRPKTNRAFWDKKVRDNVARDKRNRRRLSMAGIRVMRVWEHSVRTAKAAEIAAQSIKKRLCSKS